MTDDAPRREPRIFISHKHSDKKLADALREFIQRRSNREVHVFQSSAADADGPGLGRTLTAELKRALWDTSIVVLIYTTEDQDWQWCVWECGVATTPQSPDTAIIVFQCSTESPKVFQDAVRVNPRDTEDLLKFAKSFLTDAAFFPGYGRALAPRLSPDGPEVRDAAEDLRKSLVDVLPKADVAEWSAQPVVKLRISLDTVERIGVESASSSGPAISIADVTTVSSLDPRAKQIFGLTELQPGTTLAGLAMRWSQATSDSSIEWVQDVECQLRRAACREIPAPGWGYVRDTAGVARYAPLLSRVRLLPALQLYEFDVNLLPYDEFAATQVVSRMIPLSEMQCHRIDQTPLDKLLVRDLAQRFRKEGLSRMPFLDGARQIRMIVHRSMVDHYLALALTNDGDIPDLSTLTIADMLAKDPELGRLFQTSFKTVAEKARLSEVGRILTSFPDVQDVFVTEHGTPDEPVLGWVTNAMMAKRA